MSALKTFHLQIIVKIVRVHWTLHTVYARICVSPCCIYALARDLNFWQKFFKFVTIIPFCNSFGLKDSKIFNTVFWVMRGGEIKKGSLKILGFWAWRDTFGKHFFLSYLLNVRARCYGNFQNVLKVGYLLMHSRIIGWKSTSLTS